jgi:hypothetical protein
MTLRDLSAIDPPADMPSGALADLCATLRIEIERRGAGAFGEWIVECREGGSTLQQCANVLGVTRERVRQVENRWRREHGA